MTCWREEKKCERGCVPYRQIGKKDKHFRCMGFTNLLGEPVLCVLVVTGKEYSFQIEAGIDYGATPVGDVEDEEFLKRMLEKVSIFQVDLIVYTRER